MPQMGPIPQGKSFFVPTAAEEGLAVSRRSAAIIQIGGG
jgi:hypothetical protein